MPIYEYQCADCGFQKEIIQKISDGPLKVCPECGEGSMKKMVSAAAFRLKGGGWYETDFKSGNKKNIAGGAEKGEASKSAKTKDSAKAPSGTTSTAKKT